MTEMSEPMRPNRDTIPLVPDFIGVGGRDITKKPSLTRPRQGPDPA
jgi:hypothetical protein